MHILGIIPARGGSKTVPRKNIRMLSGFPLLAYTAWAAKHSSLSSHTILSSDDAAIITAAKKYGIDAPFIRPAEIAGDNTPTLDVLQHALYFFQQQKILFDAVCLLQPTSPFRPQGLIDACIKKFTETNADTLFTAVTVPHRYNPHWVFEKNEEGWMQVATAGTSIIPRRQQLPGAFARDGSVYIIKTETLMKDTLFGEKITCYETDAKWFVNIDDENDWQQAEEKANLFLQQFPID